MRNDSDEIRQLEIDAREIGEAFDWADYDRYLNELDEAERLSDEEWYQRLVDADVENGAIEF